MSHFRDRVIENTRGQNLPQLPTGKRATNNLPGLQQSGVPQLVVITDLTSISLSASLGTLVPTQTKNATNP